MKTFFASLGLTLVKRFLSYLFGGMPPVHDKELFRLWCLKNHRHLSFIVTKTSNRWDDGFSAMLRHILETPELYETLWNSITGSITESAAEPVSRHRRFAERLLGIIVQGTKMLNEVESRE